MRVDGKPDKVGLLNVHLKEYFPEFVKAAAINTPASLHHAVAATVQAEGKRVGHKVRALPRQEH